MEKKLLNEAILNDDYILLRELIAEKAVNVNELIEVEYSAIEGVCNAILIKDCFLHKYLTTYSIKCCPLHLAVIKNDVISMNLLLNAGANVDSVAGFPSSWIPLYFAIKLGHEEAVKFLITRDTDLNYKGTVSPLWLAFESLNPNIRAILHKNGAKLSQNETQRSITIRSTESKQKSEANVTEKLANCNLRHQQKSNVSKPNKFNPQRAVSGNLSHNKGQPYTQLQLATMKGDFRGVKNLVKNGAVINHIFNNDKRSDELCSGTCTTVLHLAIQNEHENIVEFLLRNKANANLMTCHTPLYQCILSNNKRMVNLLLNFGACCEANCKNGFIVNDVWYKILVSCKPDAYSIIMKLKDNYPDENIDSNLVYSLIKKSDDKAKKDILKTLTDLAECGLSINQRQSESVTPLLKAIFSRDFEMINILIKFGANPNLKDSKGNTALHWATYPNPNIDVVKYLIKLNCNPEEKNNYGINSITQILLADDPKVIGEGIKIYSDRGYDMSDYVSTIIKNKCSLTDHLVRLFDNGYKPTSNDLKVALMSGRTELANIILDHGKQLDLNNNLVDALIITSSKCITGGESLILVNRLVEDFGIKVMCNAETTVMHELILSFINEKRSNVLEAIEDIFDYFLSLNSLDLSYKVSKLGTALDYAINNECDSLVLKLKQNI